MDAKTTELLDKLKNSLDDLIKVYRSLLNVVRKEKEILISTNLDDLNENNKTKEGLLIKVRSMEATRSRYATELCIHLGLNAESPRLLDIAAHFGGDKEDKLRNTHSVLELLLQRVQEFNKQNEVLVQSALQNITGAMKAIKDSLNDNPTYQKQGDKAAAQVQSGQLVSREA